MSGSSSAKISKIIRILKRKYGTIEWWQGNTDEVMIGAILTQQTRWENVEKALQHLRFKGLCTIAAIRDADNTTLENAIRCTGFFRIKATRLKSLASGVMDESGGIRAMASQSDDDLRKKLLGIHGIGEETADSILCYGFSRPSFVIDAYTDRICRCAGIITNRHALKKLFEKVLPRDAQVFQQVHAHIVEYAKEYCGKRRCKECTIRTLNG
jgi:endonuclease III related protein